MEAHQPPNKCWCVAPEYGFEVVVVPGDKLQSSFLCTAVQRDAVGRRRDKERRQELAQPFSSGDELTVVRPSNFWGIGNLSIISI